MVTMPAIYPSLNLAPDSPTSLRSTREADARPSCSQLRNRIFVLWAFALAFAWAYAPAVASAAVPRVLATIKPVHSLVSAVMEGVGTPQLLIGGGSDAHDYTLKPSDAEKIANADVVFWIGPDLETFLTHPLNTLAAHAHKVALEYARGVTLLPARRGGLWSEANADSKSVNPHIWLSPIEAIAMTRAIVKTLVEADPAHGSSYEANAARRVASLEALDRKIAAQVAPLRGKGYIVFHDAYPYFETRYGLTPVGAVTVAPDRPVGPRRIAELHAALASGQAVCIFREPEFPPALIATLTGDTKARVGLLDPVGATLKPGPTLYDALIENLARGLRGCLGH